MRQVITLLHRSYKSANKSQSKFQPKGYSLCYPRRQFRFCCERNIQRIELPAITQERLSGRRRLLPPLSRLLAADFRGCNSYIFSLFLSRNPRLGKPQTSTALGVVSSSPWFDLRDRGSAYVRARLSRVEYGICCFERHFADMDFGGGADVYRLNDCHRIKRRHVERCCMLDLLLPPRTVYTRTLSPLPLIERLK